LCRSGFCMFETTSRMTGRLCGDLKSQADHAFRNGSYAEAYEVSHAAPRRVSLGARKD